FLLAIVSQFLHNLLCVFTRNHHHAVQIAYDQVAGSHGNAGTFDRNLFGDTHVTSDTGGRCDTSGEHREVDLTQVFHIPCPAINHSSTEISHFGCSCHQVSDAGSLKAIFE